MVIYGLIPVGDSVFKALGNIAPSLQVATEQSLTDTITDYVISQTSKIFIDR